MPPAPPGPPPHLQKALSRAQAHLQEGAFKAVLKDLKAYRRDARRPLPVRYMVGMALHGLGETKKAHAELAAVAKADPGGEAGLFAQSTIDMDRGRWDSALGALTALAKRQPRAAQLHNNMGLCANALGRQAEAIAHWREALRLAPGARDARLNLAQALLQASRFEAAESVLNEAPDRPVSPDADPERGALALRIALSAGWMDRARDLATAIGERWDPAGPLGPEMVRLHSVLGDSDKAAAAALAVIRAAPDQPECALTVLDLADRLADPEAGRREAVAYGRARYETVDLDKLGPGAALALGELLERGGDPAAAARCYTVGNARIKAQLASLDRHFDAARYRAFADAGAAAAETLPKPEPAAAAPDGPPEAIFIVGLPRSGTSLFAQILDSHPACRNVGESAALPRIAENIGLGEIDAPAPDGFRHLAALSEADRAALRQRYLDAVDGTDGANGRIPVDKNMYNGLYAPLIAALFDRPRILHIRRDFVDNAASILSKNFARNLPFTCDAAALADFTREQRRLIEAVAARRPDLVGQVDYEAFVTDPTAGIARLLAMLSLPDHPDCARFFETRSTVLTASRDQVRRPVFTASIGRGARLAAHLPALAEADPEGPAA